MWMFGGCVHKYKVVAKSNIVRQFFDRRGYWERLCKCECERCGKIEEQWIERDSVTGPRENKSKLVTLEWKKI